MNNLRVLVRCYDKVAQNPGFRGPPLTFALGYKPTSSRPKLRSAVPPGADVADESHRSLLVTQAV